MIELVVLFVIVISVILCIVSAMYKCTDGTMDTNDFSMETCTKLGDGTSDSPKTASNVVSEEQISGSPLLSGSGVSDALLDLVYLKVMRMWTIRRTLIIIG